MNGYLISLQGHIVDWLKNINSVGHYEGNDYI